MKTEHIEELTGKLPEITQKFNEILAENGFPHVVIQSANFGYLPCTNGTCPEGMKPTPFYNPTTMQFDLCLCVPHP